MAGIELEMFYDVIKIIHILSVISWMAGILYLPRIFVYHCGVGKNSESSELFKIMERRLLRYIMTPAMIVAWISGLIMAYSAGYFLSLWLHWKIIFVLGLSGVHAVLARFVREFASDVNHRSQLFFRVLNEAPTLLMVFIVALVVLKPV